MPNNPNVYAREDNYDPGKLNNLLKSLMNMYNSSLVNKGASGLLPIVITLEFKGVAGIKIGNLFNVSGGNSSTDVLPVSYRGKELKVKKQETPETQEPTDPRMTSVERINLSGGGKLGTNLAFVVKSLSHEISNNYWTTKIEGYPFNLDAKGKLDSYNYLDIINQARENGQPWVIIVSGGLIKIIGVTTAASNIPQRLSSFGKVDQSIPIAGRAILDTIAYAEGTAGAGSNGYDIYFGFTRIPGWTPSTSQGHPNIAVSYGGGVTHAGGRYGFQYTTWTGLFGGQNVPFTSKNQDKAGYDLVIKAISGGVNTLNDAYKVAVSGVTDINKNSSFLKMLGQKDVLKGLTNTWASIPGKDGIYNTRQGNVSYTPQDIYNVFIKAITANGGTIT